VLVADRVADRRWLWVVDSSLMMVSGGQCGDLGQVVGEDSLPGPGFRSLKAVHAGAVPAVCAFEGADAAFASGSPLNVMKGRGLRSS